MRHLLYLSTYFSIPSPIYLSVHLSIYLPVYLTTYWLSFRFLVVRLEHDCNKWDTPAAPRTNHNKGEYRQKRTLGSLVTNSHIMFQYTKSMVGGWTLTNCSAMLAFEPLHFEVYIYVLNIYMDIKCIYMPAWKQTWWKCSNVENDLFGIRAKDEWDTFVPMSDVHGMLYYPLF